MQRPPDQYPRQNLSEAEHDSGLIESPDSYLFLSLSFPRTIFAFALQGLFLWSPSIFFGFLTLNLQIVARLCTRCPMLSWAMLELVVYHTCLHIFYWMTNDHDHHPEEKDQLVLPVPPGRCSIEAWDGLPYLALLARPGTPSLERETPCHPNFS